MSVSVIVVCVILFVFSILEAFVFGEKYTRWWFRQWSKDYKDYDLKKFRLIRGATHRPNTDYYGKRDNIYEATRKYWRLNGNRARTADYVLAVYQGIVRAIFKPIEWHISDVKFETGDRWEFTGTEIEDSPYLNTNVKEYIKHGNQNPIFYINM